MPTYGFLVDITSGNFMTYEVAKTHENCYSAHNGNLIFCFFKF